MIGTQTQSEIQTPARLWFGMMGAPVIWFVHFLFVWASGELGCFAGFNHTTIAGVNSIIVLVVVGTIVGLIGTVAATLTAYGNWRRIRSETSQDEARVHGIQRFMAASGLVLGIAFTVAVILDVAPVLFGAGCERVIGV